MSSNNNSKSGLIYIGPGAAPRFPEGAKSLSGTEVLDLFNEYVAATGDEDCGGMDVVERWLEVKYDKATAAGFGWRTNFAI